MSGTQHFPCLRNETIGTSSGSGLWNSGLVGPAVAESDSMAPMAGVKSRALVSLESSGGKGPRPPNWQTEGASVLGGGTPAPLPDSCSSSGTGGAWSSRLGKGAAPLMATPQHQTSSATFEKQPILMFAMKPSCFFRKKWLESVRVTIIHWSSTIPGPSLHRKGLPSPLALPPRAPARPAARGVAGVTLTWRSPRNDRS